MSLANIKILAKPVIEEFIGGQVETLFLIENEIDHSVFQMVYQAKTYHVILVAHKEDVVKEIIALIKAQNKQPSIRLFQSKRYFYTRKIIFYSKAYWLYIKEITK